MTSCFTSASISATRAAETAGLGGDGLGGRGGNDAVFGQNRAGGRLHLEPAAVLVLFSPDAAHRRARIAFDQRRSPWKGSFQPSALSLSASASAHGGSIQSANSLIVRGTAASGARNPEALVELVEEQAAARRVGLEPLAVDDQLRNGALADVANDFGRGGRIGVDVDLGVGNAVGVEKLLGSAAVAAPGQPYKPARSYELFYG